MATNAIYLYDNTTGQYNHFIKQSEFNTAIDAKDSEIQNLKSKLMNQSEETKAKEELKNLNNFAGKLYAENEFVDVNIVCNEKTFACHKAVLGCQSAVFKIMIRNKSLNEKPTGVMEIHENDFNSETMEQVLFYIYHGNVQDIKRINTNLLRAADKFEVIGLLEVCAKYLDSNLCPKNALDVLVSAELTNQKALFDSAAIFVRFCTAGKMDKNGAFSEMLEKDPKVIAIVMSKMYDIIDIQDDIE